MKKLRHECRIYQRNNNLRRRQIFEWTPTFKNETFPMNFYMQTILIYECIRSKIILFYKIIAMLDAEFVTQSFQDTKPLYGRLNFCTSKPKSSHLFWYPSFCKLRHISTFRGFLRYHFFCKRDMRHTSTFCGILRFLS